MTQKILLVDDDLEILEAYHARLRRRFQIEIAQGGEAGLASIREKGPFAVVVTDMRMPGMDGIQFLSRVLEISPDSVRIMLTGVGEMQAAIAAVNESNVFRFLAKPCPHEVLANTLQLALAQHRLVTVKRELQEKTLHGAVKILIDILSLSNPLTFSQGSRIRLLVKNLASDLGVSDGWQFELAAMLCQIGQIALPPSVLDKVSKGSSLSPEEQKLFLSHASIGGRLLRNIPRLEVVAGIVEQQQRPLTRDPFPAATEDEKTISLGGRMLKVALDYDHWRCKFDSAASALAEMRKKAEEYDPALLGILEKSEVETAATRVRSVHVTELEEPMILDEDVRTQNGLLLVRRGQEVTSLVRDRLIAFAAGVSEPIRVRVPEREWKKDSGGGDAG